MLGEKKASVITNWPTNSEKSSDSQAIEKENFLAKCLVGTFNDSFHISPNREIIQKWLLNRWQISAGLRVTPINHNKFLFELPSKQEAIRVKNGDWFWNGRRLTLDWWSPAAESEVTHRDTGQRWVKVLGIPLHAWTTENFKKIGDQCGGYVDIDKDTKNRNQLYWARICVHSDMEFPMKVVDALQYQSSQH